MREKDRERVRGQTERWTLHTRESEKGVLRKIEKRETLIKTERWCKRNIGNAKERVCVEEIHFETQRKNVRETLRQKERLRDCKE